jgi:hypothetical protein
MLTSPAAISANVQRTPLGFISDVFGTGKAASFLASDTFIVPTGVTSIRVSTYGAGGCGATTNTVRRVSGGGGGGFARKTISVNGGENYAIIVGIGGISINASSDGLPGGSTSFGTVISATGGNGGVSNTNTFSSGGSGGVGVGGDINFSGGRGGNIDSYTSGYFATGGGGAGTLFGIGGNGGDVFGGAGSAQFQATGGGSTGGNGGSIDRSLRAGTTATGGAGSLLGAPLGLNQTEIGGAGHLGTVSTIRITTATAEANRISEYYALDYVTRFVGEFLYSEGQTGYIGSNETSFIPGPGGASGGTVNTASTVQGAESGTFAGSGGTSSPGNSYSAIGGIAGGGGACYDPNVSELPRGGDGLVTIEW